ncbi:hypothetical protein HDU87_004048 [Geranomyces variabilis]|uniref:F-box domain-containing protein n=1 Tax=Geranomyces variabilis TaxID=109894 RepID=A0AAD5TR25_9FUNG|nr:hypothetical protein HDU87_004048 [Geranomyces variabilis]
MLAPPRSLKRLRSPSMEDIVQQQQLSRDDDSERQSEAEEAESAQQPHPHDLPVLPEEIWSHTLTFVEDLDLQTLARTSRMLRRLASDRLLWHLHLHPRSAHRIANALILPQRPSRADLITANILRTTTPIRDLDRAYINGPARVAQWMAQEDLRKFFVYRALKRALEGRVTFDELGDEGFSQKNTVRSCSYNPVFLATQVSLEKKLTKSEIFKNLAHRPSVGSLESMKLLRTGPTTALMQCPPIRLKVRYFEDLGGTHSSSGPAAALSAE